MSFSFTTGLYTLSYDAARYSAVYYDNGVAKYEACIGTGGINYFSTVISFSMFENNVKKTMARADLNINGLQLFLGENSKSGKFVATQEYVQNQIIGAINSSY